MSASLVQPRLEDPAPLIERFRHDADAEDRLFRFIEEFHLPLGVLLQFAGDTTDDIGACTGQLVPGGVAVGALGADVRGAGELAISNAKKIERHGKAEQDAAGGRAMKACRLNLPAVDRQTTGAAIRKTTVLSAGAALSLGRSAKLALSWRIGHHQCNGLELEAKSRVVAVRLRSAGSPARCAAGGQQE